MQFFMYQDKIIVNYEGRPAYSIIIDKDFSNLKEELSRLKLENRRYMIITDSNVASLYLKECLDALSIESNELSSFIFDSGEGSKNLDTVYKVYSKLIEEKFDRNDIIIALGGGVTGDLAGFVASTYLRGIDFIQVPTTLLAMSDSSIGGKTGVDFMAYKNMIGAFHQPKLVYMNLSTLKSLPEREFNSGMSEILKHGLIKDYDYYKWLCNNLDGIRNQEYEILKEMIIRSCHIKKNIVEDDPKEKGDRALLNFGHTIGHAIEKLMDFKLLHGECVSIGMVAASYISYKRGNIARDEFDNIIFWSKAFGLPVTIKNLSAKDIYRVTRLDKKMQSDKIKFVYLKSIGTAITDTSVTEDEMMEAIKYILER